MTGTYTSVPAVFHCGGHAGTSPQNRYPVYQAPCAVTALTTEMRSWVLRSRYGKNWLAGFCGENDRSVLFRVRVHWVGCGVDASSGRPRLVMLIPSRVYT